MTPIIEASDVSVSFRGLQALKSVSLQVREGTAVGLIGPNGAGKSTLFNVISGLQRATTGAVRLAGTDVSHYSARRRAKLRLGRSFQHLGLMSNETVRANVLAAQYLRSGYRDRDLLVRPRRWWRGERELSLRVDGALDSLGIAARIDDVVADLSFATARLVELACVMASDATMILLDEPTTGLDINEVAVVQEVLMAMRARGLTVLTIAHDVHFVMGLCDTVYVLSEGTVISSGTPDVVRDDPRVIAAYLGRPQ